MILHPQPQRPLVKLALGHPSEKSKKRSRRGKCKWRGYEEGKVKKNNNVYCIKYEVGTSMMEMESLFFMFIERYSKHTYTSVPVAR